MPVARNGKSSLISVYAIVCERALQEQDGVVSAIRIVDVFYVEPVPDIPVEKRAIGITILASGRVAPEDDSEHTLEFFLVRPDGESTRLGEPSTGRYKSKVPGAPGGFNAILQIGVIPRVMGLHHVRVMLDGVEVARAVFTLAERKPESSQG